MYAIVNEDNGIARIGHVPLYGNKVTLMAIFLTEEDALNTLFQMELGLGVKDNHVENIGKTFITNADLVS
jgi:hypothetical protein